MAEEITLEQLEDVKRQLDGALTAAEVREVFKAHYGKLGWKRLCRMFVLGQSAQQVGKEKDRG